MPIRNGSTTVNFNLGDYMTNANAASTYVTNSNLTSNYTTKFEFSINIRYK